MPTSIRMAASKTKTITYYLNPEFPADTKLRDMARETVDDWNQAMKETVAALKASFENSFNQVADKSANVVGAVILLIVGYIVAKILDRIVSTLSDTIGLQTAAERSGLLTSMKQVGIKHSVSSILGRITFWLTMCVFLSAAFSVLDLSTLSAAMMRSSWRFWTETFSWPIWPAMRLPLWTRCGVNRQPIEPPCRKYSWVPWARVMPAMW